jgi:hypothetical protein
MLDIDETIMICALAAEAAFLLFLFVGLCTGWFK